MAKRGTVRKHGKNLEDHREGQAESHLLSL